jgi:hypothetical protein
MNTSTSTIAGALREIHKASSFPIHQHFLMA